MRGEDGEEEERSLRGKEGEHNVLTRRKTTTREYKAEASPLFEQST